jgi:UDP-N-acetylglucosamine 2-epimerase (non-hydrolysing)
MTCRLTTDRPETVFDAKSNIIVPPVNKEIISNMVKYVTNNDSLRKKMESSKKLYGSDVGKKLISVVSELIEKKDNPFKWAHDTLKLWRDNEKGIDYL